MRKKQEDPMRSAHPHPQMGAPFTHHLSYPGEEAEGAQEVCDVWGSHGRLGGLKEKRLLFRPLIP